MTGRPLHVAALPAGDLLAGRLAAALDGTGPALAPVDPGLPADRLVRLIRLLAPHAVADRSGLHGLRGGRPVRDDTALVVVTSGSTGEPKAVEIGAPALLASARASLRRIGARPGERWLCCLPSWHIAGIQVLVRSQLAGVAPLVCAPSDTAAIARAARGCAHIAVVPTQLRRLLGGTAAGGPPALTGLRTVLLGGAAAPAALLAQAAAAGARPVTTYGMTETCGGCVYDGVPLDRVEVKVGGDGRIRIAGPVLASGYRLRDDLSAAAFDDRWFVTSDLGTIGADGRLVVRGRADDVITTGGEKVAAGEVAAVLAEHPAVREAVVFGVPDAEWGERVVAAVVPADPAAPPALAELRAHAAQKLAGPCAPRQLVVLSEIPLLPAGKADVPALRTAAREQSGARSVSK